MSIKDAVTERCDAVFRNILAHFGSDARGIELFMPGAYKQHEEILYLLSEMEMFVHVEYTTTVEEEALEIIEEYGLTAENIPEMIERVSSETVASWCYFHFSVIGRAKMISDLKDQGITIYDPNIQIEGMGPLS